MFTRSIITPAFNEAVHLPHLLDSIDVARDRLADACVTIEATIANKGSTDGTAAIAQARGCLVVDVEKRAIAAARNGGPRGEALRIIEDAVQYWNARSGIDAQV